MGMVITSDKLRPRLECDRCGMYVHELFRVDRPSGRLWLCERCSGRKGKRYGELR